ncbi:arrestin domain-containing protein 1-like [Acanthaster planci]|uniref:Arrestin domain-containing protein 1-like n=1 Tax=Acanthaster planci TaxID=133434 RepID=A0A8B7ZTI3_ACAPL|nr:arrestin domain-containing protein 1-like [Acanthaster planci]
MGKLKDFQIVLEKSRKVFLQGDAIRGQVMMSVVSDGLQNVKGVWLIFHGCCGVLDAGRRHGVPRKEETYFNACITLFGKGPDALDTQDLNLLPGMHGFPFEYQLPCQPIPSSFEGEFGYVRYSATATVCLKRALGNKKFSTVEMFSIVGPTVDLNSVSGLQEGTYSTYEESGFLGLSGVKTTVKYGIPRQGFVPGENINITGHVNNANGPKHSRVFRAQLVQKIVFNFGFMTVSRKQCLAEASIKVKLKKGGEAYFTVGPLSIPPVPSSGLPGCNLIDVKHYVKVDDCEGSRAGKFAVTIGTVPFHEVQHCRQSLAGIHMKDTAAAVAAGGNCETRLPTYEEAIGIVRPASVREDSVSGPADTFVPCYPYFCIPATDPPPSYVKE